MESPEVVQEAEVAGNASAETSPEQQEQVFALPSEGTIRIGDEEFPAQEFQKRFRSQSDFDRAVQAQQKKIREQTERHYRQQFEQYQQQVRQQMQQVQRPAQGQQGGQVDLGAVFKAMRERAYVSPDDMESILNYVAPQLQKIQQMEDYVGLLHRQLAESQQGLQSVQQHRVQQETETLVRSIQELDSELLGDNDGREVVLDVLKSHEPSPGETLEEFKESVREIASKRLQWAMNVGKKHQNRELDRARRIKASGVSGGGGVGVPTGKGKPITDPEEYAKAVWAQMQA